MRARAVVLTWLVLFFPWLPGWPLRQWIPSMPFSFVVDANQAGEYALIAFSLVILPGWVGQISLGQGAFVGIGAFTTGIMARRLHVPFPLDLPVAAVASAGAATILGGVALRVRGLYLAVATLIFAWMCDAYLFASSWLVGSAGASSIPNHPIGSAGTVTYFDLSNVRVFYLVMVAAVAGAWFLAVNLRDSKTGRAFFSIRGSETAAVSLGIDVARYKLLAFAISGGLAGIAGNLFMTDVRAATPVQFQFTTSLFYLAIAVIGGINNLGGALAASVLFAGLAEAFYNLSFLNGWLDVVTIGLLLAVLLGYPGGLAALGRSIAARSTAVGGRLAATGRTLRAAPARMAALARLGEPPGAAEEAGTVLAPVVGPVGTAPPGEAAEDAGPAGLLDLVAGRRRGRSRPGLRRGARIVRHTIDFSDLTPSGARPTVEELALPAAATPEPAWRSVRVGGRPRATRAEAAPVLEASGVTVRFGGLTAVEGFSLEVRKGEIVGLIGPNGAGKTTTFNAIAGLNRPAAGRVRLFGQDVTRMPVHLRAQMGVGRTFQLIQLFPQLTVFDNLLVATHVDNPTGWVSHVALTGKAILAEREARERVRFVVSLVGLEEVADRRVAGLPFGLLRQVEIARALVTRPPLLMLDEPASGLDNAETDDLARLLTYLRSDVGISILLIEHDVRLVTSVSDYMYVVNRGRPLAEGTPAQVQRNPEVVAAYLGEAAEAEAV